MGATRVRYGLRNVHYAKLSIEEDDVVTYGTPVKIPGAVSLSLDAEGDVTKTYADDIVYWQKSKNNGYSGTLEMMRFPDSFRKDILGETEDSNKVLVEDADAQISPFALLFEFEGDATGERHVLYNVTPTRPSIESETTEDTVEPGTESIDIEATPLPTNRRVKARSGESTTPTVYNDWFKSVYVSPASAS